MTSLTDIDGSVFAFEFDGEGNRLSQCLNDCLSKRFVYDGADVLLELNPTNGVAYAWVNGPGIDQPIERLLFIDGEPRARRVFHSDALGSVAALTDPDGLVTQTYAYSAFGSLRSSAGHDPNRVTYTAREQLGDSQGWMYYRYRVYLPSSSRFSGRKRDRPRLAPTPLRPQNKDEKSSKDNYFSLLDTLFHDWSWHTLFCLYFRMVWCVSWVVAFIVPMLLLSNSCGAP